MRVNGPELFGASLAMGCCKLWGVLALFGLAVVSAAALTVISLCWIAKGEADVNGDPERDAIKK